jgi:hypothetical protein
MTTTATRHHIEVKYTLWVTDETIEGIKDRNGTHYWVSEEDAEVSTNELGDVVITFDGKTFTYDTETCLRGLGLWAQTHTQEQLDEVITQECDHFDNDEIWQLGFFGQIIYG